MIVRRSTPFALAAAILFATPLAAMAGDYTIIFQFWNERPGGEVLTGRIDNQGRVGDLANGSLTEIGSINFATSGSPSTGHYDVRVSAKGNYGHEYCDYHATATHNGTMGTWTCSVQRQSSGNGATCTGRVSNLYPITYPCVFEIDVK